MSKIKIIPVLTFLLFFLIIFYFLTTLGLDLEKISNKEHLLLFYNSLNVIFEKNFLNSFIYLLLSVIYIFFLGFPLPLIIITSIIFNSFFAIVISVISITLGSLLTYIFFLRTIKFNLYDYSTKINKLKKYIKKNELFSVFFFRILSGGLPFLIQNLIIFSLNIKTFSFFIGTLFSSIIGISILVLFGKNLIILIKSIII
jgi:uncharacterized membrane protein YdjX (TVP38/TMEM64 family)